jgi:hypothetical protein
MGCTRTHSQRIITRHGSAVWLVILIVISCAATACKIRDESDEHGAVAAVLVGPEGGIVEVTDSASGILGARVYIPAGALDREQSISISRKDLPAALPAGYRTGGKCIDFRPEGIRFSQPVLLYLPYDDTNNDGIIDGRAVREGDLFVLYYNSLNSRWEEMPLYGVDTGNNLAAVESMHFSTYLAAVDTADARTIDSGFTGTNTGPFFEPGECYLGNDSFCHYSHMTVLRRKSGLTAIVDRNLTYVNSGIVAAISEDGSSAAFDAASAFAKVLASGDATQWVWEGEFVREHTFLMDYEVRQDDTISSQEPGATGPGDGAGGIFCRVEAVDMNMVKITWEIDVFEQIIYQTTAQGSGHCLAIRFRATHR